MDSSISYTMARSPVNFESCAQKLLGVSPDLDQTLFIVLAIMVFTFTATILFVLLCYMVIDVTYFVRAFFTYIFAKYCRKRIRFGDTSAIYGIVLPSDIDVNVWHMNNGRFCRELDFCRGDYFIRANVHDLFFIKHGGAVSGHCIRYRQPMRLFAPYKIITKPVWWDDRSIYFEHRAISILDKKLRFISYCRVGFQDRSFDVSTMLSRFPEVKKPEKISPDLQSYMEYNERSKAMLKEESESRKRNGVLKNKTT